MLRTLTGHRSFHLLTLPGCPIDRVPDDVATLPVGPSRQRESARSMTRAAPPRFVRFFRGRLRLGNHVKHLLPGLGRLARGARFRIQRLRE
jgi:hypothetical protein